MLWLALSTFLFASQPVRILVLGDSLTEGYGVAQDAAYPKLLEDKLKADGKDVVVINGGISGSTSSSGLDRLKWHLKSKPDILVLALGANDGLRGIRPKVMKNNLKDILELAKSNHLKILFLGMKMPPNYGGKYTKDYEAVFTSLAKEEHVDFVPFMLEGVAGKPDLNQTDGIHPNEQGHKILSTTVYKAVKKLL